MKSEQRLNSRDIKLIRRLEDIAIKLDDGIQHGEVQTRLVTRSQVELNDIAEKLIGTRTEPNSKTYIVYELQALIHWINNEETQAGELIVSAKNVKGDMDLYTETGRQLIKTKVSDWTGNDSAAVILVGLFWLIGVIVILLSSTTPKNKKGKIIGYGTIVAIALSIIIRLALPSS